MALERGLKARMTGGEPLWHVSQKPNVFYFKAKSRQRRWQKSGPPKLTQRNVSPSAFVQCGMATGAIELPRVETFPGAACLPSVLAAPRFSIESVGFLSQRPKRLPSRRTPCLPFSTNHPSPITNHLFTPPHARPRCPIRIRHRSY